MYYSACFFLVLGMHCFGPFGLVASATGASVPGMIMHSYPYEPGRVAMAVAGSVYDRLKTPARLVYALHPALATEEHGEFRELTKERLLDKGVSELQNVIVGCFSRKWSGAVHHVSM